MAPADTTPLPESQWAPGAVPSGLSPSTGQRHCEVNGRYTQPDRYRAGHHRVLPPRAVRLAPPAAGGNGRESRRPGQRVRVVAQPSSQAPRAGEQQDDRHHPPASRPVPAVPRRHGAAHLAAPKLTYQHPADPDAPRPPRAGPRRRRMARPIAAADPARATAPIPIRTVLPERNAPPAPVCGGPEGNCLRLRLRRFRSVLGLAPVTGNRSAAGLVLVTGSRSATATATATRYQSATATATATATLCRMVL